MQYYYHLVAVFDDRDTASIDGHIRLQHHHHMDASHQPRVASFAVVFAASAFAAAAVGIGCMDGGKFLSAVDGAGTALYGGDNDLVQGLGLGDMDDSIPLIF